MTKTMDNYRMMWMGLYMPCHDHIPPVTFARDVLPRNSDYWIEVGIHDHTGGFSVMHSAVNLP